VNATDGRGWTALIHASALHGNEATAKPLGEIVQILIQAAANVNAIENDCGWTALLASTCGGTGPRTHTYASTVELLLKSGAEVNVRGRHGETPLLCANTWHTEGIDIERRGAGAIHLLSEAGGRIGAASLEAAQAALTWVKECHANYLARSYSDHTRYSPVRYGLKKPEKMAR
jgi:hypothetical protein